MSSETVSRIIRIREQELERGKKGERLRRRDKTQQDQSEGAIYCEQIIQQNSRSFYFAFRTLPREQREGVFALYALCRLIDDLVDEPENHPPLPDLLSLWSRFKEGETPPHPLFFSLREAFNRFELSYDPLDELIQGIELDKNFTQIESMEELEHYCYLVAGTVGLMLLPILSPHYHRHPSVREGGIQLGKAMQLTNILRDVGEDLKRDRCYLPQSLLDEFGVQRSELERGEITSRYQRLAQHLRERALSYYRLSLRSILTYEKRAKRASIDALFLYRRILTTLKREGYDSLSHRSVPSPAQVRRTLLKSRLYQIFLQPFLSISLKRDLKLEGLLEKE